MQALLCARLELPMPARPLDVCCVCLPGYMERYTKSLAKEAVSGYSAVAKKHGLTPAQLALAWCKGRWNVTSSIIGATSLEQLKVANQALLTPSPFSSACGSVQRASMRRSC